MKTDDDYERQAEAVARRMRDAGVWVSFDLRVDAAAAAELLGRTAKTLANWRSSWHPLRYVRGPRTTYRLVDLLRYIDAGQDASAA